jgi:polyisoprenoid-binding protein YceI
MRRRIVLFGSVATVAVVAVVAVGVWYFLFRDDAPAAVDINDAVAAAASPTTAARTATSVATGTTASATSAAGTGTAAASTATTATGTGDLAGTWQVVSGSQSFVGYRVKEELAQFGAATAVGRTSGVTGSLAFDGTTITAVTITADLSKLASDRNQRDDQLKMQALETRNFPTATFKLTQPIKLDKAPAAGVTISADAVGDLTLHGVTKSVQIPIKGQLVNGQVVVVGSTEIVFADYNIAQPTSFSVLSVENHGTLELQLYFGK